MTSWRHAFLANGSAAPSEHVSCACVFNAPCPCAAPSEAAWHLDMVEVACKAGGSTARPTYFVCRRWLDERCSYRAELAASTRNPRQEEVDYKVAACASEASMPVPCTLELQELTPCIGGTRLLNPNPPQRPPAHPCPPCRLLCTPHPCPAAAAPATCLWACRATRARATCSRCATRAAAFAPGR